MAYDPLGPIERCIERLLHSINECSRQYGFTTKLEMEMTPAPDISRKLIYTAALVFSDGDAPPRITVRDLESLYAELIASFTRSCEEWGWEWEGVEIVHG